MNKTKDVENKNCPFNLILKHKNRFQGHQVDFLASKLTLKIENGEFVTAVN